MTFVKVGCGSFVSMRAGTLNPGDGAGIDDLQIQREKEGLQIEILLVSSSVSQQNFEPIPHKKRDR